MNTQLSGWLQFALFLVALVADHEAHGALSSAGARCEGQDLARSDALRPLNGSLTRLMGVDPKREQIGSNTRLPCCSSAWWDACSLTPFCGCSNFLPLNPQGLGPVSPTSGLQHRSQFHHQYELAELRRRSDDVLLLPDGGVWPFTISFRRQPGLPSRPRWCAASRGKPPGRWAISGSISCG